MKVSRQVALWLGMLVISSTPAWGTLEEIPEAAGFSADSVLFDFSGTVAGAGAEDVLNKWGIVFERSEDSVPRIGISFQLGFVNQFVVNQPANEDSPDQPLAIRFRNPARKVGFVLRNAGSSAEVTAFDAQGRELGTVTLNTSGEPNPQAVGTTDPAGISLLLIRYMPFGVPGPPAPVVEEIDDLHVEFLNRPEFSIYFAQVGDAPIPGFGALQTAFVVTNLSGSTANGEIRFFDSQGVPMAVATGSGTGEVFPLALPARGSFSFSTLGTSDPIAVGYAKVTCNVPIDGTGIFKIVNTTGGLISEAGVGAAEGRYVSIGAVQKTQQGNFDSGIAVVNTGTESATSVIELLDEQGVVQAANLLDAQLDPGHHNAKFLSELFPAYKDASFTGTVRVSSNQPLAMVILRAAAGIVQSSLPVGSLE